MLLLFVRLIVAFSSIMMNREIREDQKEEKMLYMRLSYDGTIRTGTKRTHDLSVRLLSKDRRRQESDFEIDSK